MADVKKQEPAPTGKIVTLFNRGVRIFRLPGGKSVAPGATIEVDDALAKRLRGYRDLVDAGAMSPRQKDHVARLEASNASLKDQVADLTKKLAEKAQPPVPGTEAVPPAAPAGEDAPPDAKAGKKGK